MAAAQTRVVVGGLRRGSLDSGSILNVEPLRLATRLDVVCGLLPPWCRPRALISQGGCWSPAGLILCGGLHLGLPPWMLCGWVLGPDFPVGWGGMFPCVWTFITLVFFLVGLKDMSGFTEEAEGFLLFL